MEAGSFMDTMLNRRFRFVIRFVTVKLLKMTAMSKEHVRDLYQRLQLQEKITHKYLA